MDKATWLLSGLWSDYTRESLAKRLPVQHVAPGC